MHCLHIIWSTVKQCVQNSSVVLKTSIHTFCLSLCSDTVRLPVFLRSHPSQWEKERVGLEEFSVLLLHVYVNIFSCKYYVSVSTKQNLKPLKLRFKQKLQWLFNSPLYEWFVIYVHIPLLMAFGALLFGATLSLSLPIL